MRIIIYLPLLFFTITGFCKNTLSGAMPAFPLSTYKIVHNQTMVNAYQGETLAEGKTDLKGGFSASFELDSEQPILFFIGNQFFKIWLVPNSDLTITENHTNFDFKGETSAENYFLFKSGIMRPYTVETQLNSSHFEPDKQLIYLDKLEKDRWELYETTFQKRASSRFQSFIKGETVYFTYLYKNQYPQRFLYMTKTIQAKDIPPLYYSFWLDFKVLDDVNFSDVYQNSLQAYIEFMAKKRVKNPSDLSELYRVEFELIDSLLKDRPLTRQRQKAEAIRFLIQYTDQIELSKKEIDRLYADFPNSHYIYYLETAWKKKNKHMFTTPDFQLKDVHGSSIDIRRFKGKVIYIDFWGSWCKPCMALMPSSEKLREKFKTKNVVFLYINFHDSKDRWLKTINEKRLQGVHLKAEKENEAYFNDTFGIGQGFPRYALIDTKGVLITMAAPRPDSEQIVSFIEKALKEQSTGN